jgi:hypothetical protein
METMAGLAVVPREALAIGKYPPDAGGLTEALETVDAQVLALGEHGAVAIEAEPDEVLA